MQETEFTVVANEDLDSPRKLGCFRDAEVYAKVIAGPDTQFSRQGKISVLHLELVSNTGNYFNLTNAPVKRQELYELELFYRRHREHLGSLYFPGAPSNEVDLRPGVVFIDPEEGLRVTFFLTKLLPYD